MRSGTRARLHAELWAAAAGSQPGWKGAASPGVLGDKVPGTLGQGGGREEEPGQMEDFGHSCQVLRVEPSG